ncbi:MAG: hypothetical protein AAGU76_02760 [Sedimentibacter sp.]|uniref:hypothetical protein n=1 Tax=Sedimentibacter sp. TaxID=1960295 RepID=UPI00315936ED
MDVLTQIKLITGKTDETIINLLIDKTKQEVAIYCKTDYVSAMDNLTVDMVCYKLNTLNTDGISSQSYNGISESYTSDYPIYIKSQLNAFRKRVYFL